MMAESSLHRAAARILKDPKSSKAARTVAASALVRAARATGRLRKSVNLRRLDNVADRLGALYQNVGKLSGRTVSNKNKLMTSILDEIVALTEEVESISGRK